MRKGDRNLQPKCRAARETLRKSVGTNRIPSFVDADADLFCGYVCDHCNRCAIICDRHTARSHYSHRAARCTKNEESIAVLILRRPNFPHTNTRERLTASTFATRRPIIPLRTNAHQENLLSYRADVLLPWLLDEKCHCFDADVTPEIESSWVSQCGEEIAFSPIVSWPDRTRYLG